MPVFADSTNGVLASVFVILGLGGFTLVNLALQLLFYFNGQYSSRRFVTTHTVLSLLMPLLATAMVLEDNSSTAYLMLNLGLIIIAASLALLPLQLKTRLVAVAIMQVGYSLAPVLCCCYCHYWPGHWSFWHCYSAGLPFSSSPNSPYYF
ncbi:hypothetical protein KHX94_01530 [Shewanella dokdonensis]|uniref:EamA domain-containing protein n=1 Tax=Shewanella dokdonensis TaxID=712036 RepID=A0ABX8DFI2_9GAMM|nr:hypothetical protein [Shewanella dokdonensis]QVK23489.1 hypothetical protein KHX94_01530 [Shewanella dokdonensis]